MESSGSDDSSDKSSAGESSLVQSQSDRDMDSSSNSDADDEKDPTNVDSRPGEWMELHALLESERYWDKQTKRFQSKEFSETFFYELIPEHLFRQMTRMGKLAFQKLVTSIENHCLYHNRSLYAQAPIALRLATCLDRLGHSGNGSCLKHTLLLWGISVGSCVNYTRRTIIALHDCIGDVLKWPDAAERSAISLQFAQKGFPNCIGLIDGTTFPLAQKPAFSGEVYFERKSRYSINAQVVCDYNRRIMFIYSGCQGSCSDITCLRRSGLWDRIHGDSLFDPEQYILADSGYVNAPHMACAYKMTMQNRDRIDFNFTVAKARVVNEHCIGILKNRWFSLKEIRLQLNKNSDHAHMCRWIIACALLHNYVHDCNDPWTPEDMLFAPLDPTVEIPPDEALHRRRFAASREAGARLLARVQAISLLINRWPGGCLSNAL